MSNVLRSVPPASHRRNDDVGMLRLKDFAAAAILLFFVSRIFVGYFTQSHIVTSDILVCALVALSTYILWSKWTSIDHRQRGDEPDGSVQPDANLLGNKLDSTFEHDERKVLEAASGSSASDVAPAQESVESTPKTKLVQGDYTVGWICAISTEQVAAQLFLDEMHEDPDDLSAHDYNSYVLGRVEKHNVVIGVLPDREYGTSTATAVAKDMLHSFPNIRIGLMVGIAGGAPSQKHDIRLGDIVVSVPGEGEGGVFQYDYGKVMEGERFQTTGFLNQPPPLLRTTVASLKSKYEIRDHGFDAAINRLLQKNPRLQQRYKRPEPSKDRLYRPGVLHQGNKDTDCEVSCGTDPKILISRRPRTRDEDNPAIHYGLIASANSLMKDSTVRDRLSAENGVLCFEMEAAGLMNQFPCLVVRGICDYSDTHKNKEWQGYAAMVAAAYAKDLLCKIAPRNIEKQKRLSDILSDLHGLATKQLNATKAQLQLQERLAETRLSDRDKACHQVFRLTNDGTGAAYEWYKDRVEKRVEDTCLWLLQHENFQMWLKHKNSGPLLVSADPGCGKSVLARYLIDEYLPRSSTICYFFFKDQDQNTARQALCALLHQLFEQKPSLLDHAHEQLEKDGSEGLRNSTESLWKVLRNAVSDPDAGTIIIVLDALDECAESDFEDLVKKIERLFWDDINHDKLKCFLTSRPYSQILSKFHALLRAFPNIRIPGEEESEAISQEVNRVITYRINQLSDMKYLLPDTASYLETKLKQTTHRTYLWVYLVFKYLEKEDFKTTLTGVKEAIKQLPGNVYEAYEKILHKSTNYYITRKVLSIILAASRPLTVIEMNIAINIDEKKKHFKDLDLENEQNFTLRLRSCCGLFVSIYHGRVYLLHQTAREFLLADPAPVFLGEQWHHSITIRQAHTVLAELCMRYIDYYNSDSDHQTPAITDGTVQPHDIFAFMAYSSENWAAHFHEADYIPNVEIKNIALRICDPNSAGYSVWFDYYRHAANLQYTVFTNLMTASNFGLKALVKLFLDAGADVNSEDVLNQRSALSWAAASGYEAVIKILLEKGAKVNSKDLFSQTPLCWAAMNGHIIAIELLLEKGAKINSKDNLNRTPLSWAVRNNHKAVIELLLEKGGVVDSEDTQNKTPLSWAAENGHHAIVKSLLNTGADIDLKDGLEWRTPLSWAAENGHHAIIKLLLSKGADVDLKDGLEWRTPLSWAAQKGHTGVVELLIDNGAEVDSKNYLTQTPLSFAAQGGHPAVVELLIDNGAEVDSKNRRNQTPLSFAAQEGHPVVVELLLDNGAEVDSMSSSGLTPLYYATVRGWGPIQQLLRARGAANV